MADGHSTRSHDGRGATVVVGAAQGIGETVARRLALEPSDDGLFLADLRYETVQALAAELSTSTGRTVTAAAIDVSSPDSIEAFAATVPHALRLAVVAGIFDARSSLDVGWKDFSDVLAVNLLGNYFVAKEFARSMVEREGGSIVAVSSIAARMPRLRQAAYCASKAGMRQALRVLAMEVVPRGVRINFVAPGPTDTPMMRDLSADHTMDDLATGDLAVFRPRIPVGSVASPEDVAAGVSFLLSDAARHIAMHDLYVDGGETLGL